jgi:hypothetical protein
MKQESPRLKARECQLLWSTGDCGIFEVGCWQHQCILSAMEALRMSLNTLKQMSHSERDKILEFSHPTDILLAEFDRRSAFKYHSI